MNIKEYIKENGIKLSNISKVTGIPYTTIGDV